MQACHSWDRQWKSLSPSFSPVHASVPYIFHSREVGHVRKCSRERSTWWLTEAQKPANRELKAFPATPCPSLEAALLVPDGRMTRSLADCLIWASWDTPSPQQRLPSRAATAGVSCHSWSPDYPCREQAFAVWQDAKLESNLLWINRSQTINS